MSIILRILILNDIYNILGQAHFYRNLRFRGINLQIGGVAISMISASSELLIPGNRSILDVLEALQDANKK